MPSPADPAERAAPDFVGVGAAGAGATWWMRLLANHPEIRGPQGARGAVRHFERFAMSEMTDADVAAYHAHFPRVPGTIAGEWTARYMLDGWTPPLLRRAAPDAKLLVILGDPIARYRTVFATRRESFGPDERFYTTDIAERSRHATQLTRLQRFFPAERILVLQYERCLADPVAEYRRTLRFLGVRDTNATPRLLTDPGSGGRLSRWLSRIAALGLPGRATRRAAERVAGRPLGRIEAPLWPDLEAALHTALDPDVERLAAMLPEFDLGLWPNFRHLAAPARS
jgi:hypothetical protein